MQKLLATGKTDLLDKFVSMRTRRAFKAMLVWDSDAGKVNFEFAPSKFPPRKPAYKAASTGAAAKPAAKSAARAPVKKAPASKTAAAKTGISKKAPTQAKAAKPGAARKTSSASGMRPDAALGAVIGDAPLARPQVIKKLWDYIKANGLQDATNRRAINADEKLLAVFGKAQVTMFELAGIVGKHLVEL